MSQFGSAYTTIGAGGTVYLIGRLSHNDHLAETGRLGTEAVIDATLVAEALKLATNRQRPDVHRTTRWQPARARCPPG